MKKVINGNLVNVDINFFSEYLYGKELNKITLSDIKNDVKLDKKINSYIDLYRDVYNSLDDMFKVIETNEKYCILGELTKKDYFVCNKAILFKLNTESVIEFKGTHWAIKLLSDINGKKITWEDIKNEKSSLIYAVYLKFGKKEWLGKCFPSIFEAVDKDVKKFNIELPNILSFINVKPLDIGYNEIFDTTKQCKYTIFKNYKGSKENSAKKQIYIDLDNISQDIKETNALNEVYTYSIYKQNLIEGKSGKIDYGEEIKKDNLFSDIFINLTRLNVNNIKGLIIDNKIYYECNNDIWISYNDRSEKLIQNGHIYGVYDNKLLIKYTKNMEQGIVKNIIYVLDNNYLDIVNITFSSNEV